MSNECFISAVSALPGKQALRIVWRDGSIGEVDLNKHIYRLAVLRPVLFQQARVGAWGLDVVWPCDIELSAGTLYRLGLEQAG